MARHEFVSKRFTRETLEVIGWANAILEEYEGQGFTLTLRQLYYQLVARGRIENTVRSYKRIGDIVSNARLGGVMDWDMIEDRGRVLIYPSHWESPAEIARDAARQFRLDRWEGQPCYVEVMAEKDAVSGILRPVCNELDIRFTANKGYSSSSALYEAGHRLRRAGRAGKKIHLFYFGDHDPSGIDMTRDVRERLELFTWEQFDMQVHRLALNMPQVEEWRPPENPAKETDSRYAAYAAEFGESSWELDAVEPRQMAALLRDAVTDLREEEAFEEVMHSERRMIRILERFADAVDNGEFTEDLDGEE